MKSKNFKDIKLPKFDIDSKAEAGLRRKQKKLKEEKKRTSKV